MRSTFAGLNTMVSGLQTNRLSLETVGHNLTNANTDGYSRQSVNQTATNGQVIGTIGGTVIGGTGVTATSLTRARDIYADRQYWQENSTLSYYEYTATNYNKLETIFNDADENGIQDGLERFYTAWVDVSTSASTATSRQNVIDQGQLLTERLQAANTQLQNQIVAIYDDMTLSIQEINSLTTEIVELNKNIQYQEATGASANDLKDQRDLLVDELSGYIDLNVYEDANGNYKVVSNGTSLVNGVTKLTLELSRPINNASYGVSDYVILIKETDTSFIPGGGEVQAQLDAIEEDKEYMDYISNIAAFMLTSLNAQHRAGAGIDADTTTGINFYGEDGYVYEWDADNNTVVKTKCDVTYEYADDKDKDQPHTLTSVKYEKSADDKDKTVLKGLEVLAQLYVNPKLQEADTGRTLLATRQISFTNDKDETITNLIYPENGTYKVADLNGSADGTVAVSISTLINRDLDNTAEAEAAQALKGRPIGTVSLYAYYNSKMTSMGANAEAMNVNVTFQSDVMEQIENVRQSTAGVNYDEELSNMIMFQQGYQACSRCLNAMDEMLDKLINGTGTVGR